MSARTRRGNVDYGRVAKLGFLGGVGLFLLGAVGEAVARATVAGIPEAVDSVLLVMEAGGILVALLVPIVFGAVLPLIE